MEPHHQVRPAVETQEEGPVGGRRGGFPCFQAIREPEGEGRPGTRRRGSHRLDGLEGRSLQAGPGPLRMHGLHLRQFQEQGLEGHPGAGPGLRVGDLDLQVPGAGGSEEIRKLEGGQQALAASHHAQVLGGERADRGRVLAAPEQQLRFPAEGIGPLPPRQDRDQHRLVGGDQRTVGTEGQALGGMLRDHLDDPDLGTRGQERHVLERQRAVAAQAQFALKEVARLAGDRLLRVEEGPALGGPLAGRKGDPAQHTGAGLPQVAAHDPQGVLALVDLHVVHHRQRREEGQRHPEGRLTGPAQGEIQGAGPGGARQRLEGRQARAVRLGLQLCFQRGSCALGGMEDGPADAGGPGRG